MYYTYILKSLKDNNTYTGHTNNLKRRFIEHNQGLSLATKFRGPWILIYYEACLNEKDAIRREKYLKSGKGERYIKSRLKYCFKNEK